MVRIPIFLAAFVAALPATTALAQSSGCDGYKVDARLLNVRNEPNVFGNITGVLRADQIVCIGEVQNTTGQQWGSIVSVTEPDGTAAEPVDGWSNMRYMSPASMPTTAANPTPVAPDTGTETAPEPAPTGDGGDTATTPPPPTTTTAGGVPTFEQPWETGPYPLRGRSLEQLANAIPLFAPIQGLADEVWQRPCTSCHQWNRDRLCEQGQSYTAHPANILRIQHPHGGPVKNALAQWAAAGCP